MEENLDLNAKSQIRKLDKNTSSFWMGEYSGIARMRTKTLLNWSQILGHSAF
jgi:hypothetical protein